MTRIVLAVIVALWSSLVAAQAVPEWALGRNGSNQLQVDGGVLGTVTFASEYAGTDPSDTENPGCTPRDRVAYDRTVDGYEGRTPPACLTTGACPNNDTYDLVHPVWKDTAHRHVLIKNWDIKNAFKTTLPPHVDVTQVLDAPGWGGWFVIQDSTLKNTDDGLVQWQFGYVGTGGCGSVDGYARNVFGGVVVQNLVLGQESAFNADCNNRAGGDDGCALGNGLGSWNGPNVGWFINYQTNGFPITLQQNWDKVIIVGNTPDFLFRADNIGYNFATASTCTGSPCSFSNRAWGPYASIEDALAAGHAEPPFIRLSCSGWANTANCAAAGGGSAPSAPTNFRFVGFDLDLFAAYRE